MLIVVFLLCLVVILEVTNTTHFFHKKKEPAVATGAALSSKGETRVNNNGKSTTTAGNNSETISLLTPSGDFVSNHHPNLSGSPAPNTESSVCNTSPGASCTISFESNGSVKSLATKQADTNGSVFWSWKLSDIGITSGTWKITAKATLSNKSKSAADSMELVVTQ